ncbi:hypothetical protein Nepgr_022852 [Nepenthes gracilis]|uniref:Uncharacterized protein n=1 Tax=Nepenthes gracilis TaxID=150966 RepID=A0AAD3T1F9_NEPGR|nr:hypothetical protein Nepgr_022852 [Nepenthes gracilis]
MRPLLDASRAPEWCVFACKRRIFLMDSRCLGDLHVSYCLVASRSMGRLALILVCHLGAVLWVRFLPLEVASGRWSMQVLVCLHASIPYEVRIGCCSGVDADRRCSLLVRLDLLRDTDGSHLLILAVLSLAGLGRALSLGPAVRRMQKMKLLQLDLLIYSAVLVLLHNAFSAAYDFGSW